MRSVLAAFRYGWVRGPCSRAVNTVREHGCHFGHPSSRAMLVNRAIPGVLQVKNNYDVIINNGLLRRPVFVGGQNMPVYTREHGRQYGP